MNFCKYSKIFGLPGKGVHKYRLFNIAIVDVVGTIAIALIIHYIFHLNFLYVALFLFSLGIFLHRLFCVKTTIDKLIG